MTFTKNSFGNLVFEKDNFCPFLKEDNTCKKEKTNQMHKILDEKKVINVCMKNFKNCEKYRA